MNPDELRPETSEGLAAELKRMQVHALKEHAEHAAFQAVNKLVEDGRAVELSDDEMDMIKAYRRFVARSRPGKRFKWTTPTEPSLVIPEAPSLIIDPREVEPV